ncbi:MAG TPA: hypothetical protein VF622_17045 [Segetibacter sp.]|jgi:hypothetical protein
MKLIFKKDENKEINIKIQKGTIAEDFTYIEMIKQLLAHNDFNDTDFTNLSEDEKERLTVMLAKISNIFKEEEG